ncbi:matrilin-3a isoform X4 [Hippocampus comes]|uniref:matrilin-3a isoform X4 n=1 Tax=Hippocampus comes TaxID=109280 RepID=UPI00094EF1E7|nr:PREDICTED: non-classical arabinogalactan protein 31-like isoform X4 [Hippocampus comes]
MRMMVMMKCWLWGLVCGTPLMLGDVLATYRLNAQSFAQSRNNGQPPTRTLNPEIHRGDYTYRGGYHYHYQPPRIPPPVVYRPFPYRSPPVTYHRPAVPMWPYQHTFKGQVVPQVPHIYKGIAPPLVHHPHHYAIGHYYPKGPCPTKPNPTVATRPAVYLPIVPPTQHRTTAPTAPPTLPPTSTTSATPAVTTTLAPVESTTPEPVSTQSGFTTTISPVKTGLDPCATGNDCEHICVNNIDSYYCKCRTGYILNADRKTCSQKQVRGEVVVDPCKCEARLAFQKQTQVVLQQLTTTLADFARRIWRLEEALGRA